MIKRLLLYGVNMGGDGFTVDKGIKYSSLILPDSAKTDPSLFYEASVGAKTASYPTLNDFVKQCLVHQNTIGHNRYLM